MITTALQQLIFIAILFVQAYRVNELSNDVRWLHNPKSTGFTGSNRLLFI
jgi:hypothetical protein